MHTLKITNAKLTISEQSFEKSNLRRLEEKVPNNATIGGDWRNCD